MMWDDLFIPAAQTLRSLFQPIQEALRIPGEFCSKIFFTWNGLILLCSLYFVILICGLIRLSAQREGATAKAKAASLYVVEVMSGLPQCLSIAMKLWLLAGIVVALQFVSEAAYRSADSLCRLYEMRQVVAQLSEQTEIAGLQVKSRTCGERPLYAGCPEDQVQTTVELTFYDGAENQKPWVRSYRLKGREVYLASLVFNFDRSLFSDGEHRNLCIPYALYTEQIPRDEAVRIQTSEEQDLPIYYKREDESIYGITPEIFRSRAIELMKILDDPKQSREEGIRTSQGILHGSAIHKELPVGERYTIYLHQADGLSLKKDVQF